MTKTLTQINNIVNNLDDRTFDKLNDYYTSWLFSYGKNKIPKARVNYWLNKAGLTMKEWETWCAN